MDVHNTALIYLWTVMKDPTKTDESSNNRRIHRHLDGNDITAETVQDVRPIRKKCMSSSACGVRVDQPGTRPAHGNALGCIQTLPSCHRLSTKTSGIHLSPGSPPDDPVKESILSFMSSCCFSHFLTAQRLLKSICKTYLASESLAFCTTH